ncbi:MAG TPA: sigma-54 dependent transcriptional regulator [Thermoanaerobaculia bacterium]|nr:sigma-54 dependent transcriptional regulator [Thermoanaerobaculia bacterium]
MALALIVEDESLLRWALSRQLERAGHKVHAAPDLAAAAEHITAHRPDVILLDLGLPDGHGLDFFEANRERMAESKVIVMTALSQVEEAVRAMKLGAIEFLTKPVDEADLVALVNRSLAVRNDQLEAQAMRRSRELRLSKQAIGESAPFKGVLDVIDQVAASDIPSILIQGESGSGKNVLARRVHSLSARQDKPILEVSCATIPENLLESELFGHEKGAFTDAKGLKRGVFELAEGGTVVLDEIGELRLDMQAKLLHFLEERRFRRVGGTREIQVDIRVVGLTNRDLQAMVREKTFRTDLFYRLNVFPVAVPPLRERPEDVLPLARHFLTNARSNLGTRFSGFDAEAERLLVRYPWPGNVRELRNVVERALVVERGEKITARSLMLDAVPAEEGASGAAVLPPGIVPLETLEREMILRAMLATGGNTTRAAEPLGISRDQLRYRLKKLGIRESGD